MLNFKWCHVIFCDIKIQQCSFLKDKFSTHVNFSEIPIENNTKNKRKKNIRMQDLEVKI